MTFAPKKLILASLIATTLLLGACAGGGYRGEADHGIGYGHYYGPRPWSYYPGYIDVDPGPGIGDGPVATPLPEMGMPDFGGGVDMGMGMEMGGFDF